MKDAEKVSIAESFRIEQPFIKEDSGDFNVYKYVEKYIYESIDSWDNFCIDSLYKEYQKYGFTKVFVINREEFKRFLLWALPLYYEKERKENGNDK